jgi:hypothetical protein
MLLAEHNKMKEAREKREAEKKEKEEKRMSELRWDCLPLWHHDKNTILQLLAASQTIEATWMSNEHLLGRFQFDFKGVAPHTSTNVLHSGLHQHALKTTCC